MRISKTLWQGALLALVTCGPAASLAQDAAEADVSTTDATETESAKTEAPKADAARAEAKDAPARPFIERSLVIAPEQVGKFKLYSMNDYPGQPGAGVQIRYQHEDFPTVRVDLFVYPAGRVEREALMVSAMTELRASIQYAVDQGQYSGVTWGDETEFNLARVDEDGSLLPRADAKPPAGKDEAARMAAAAEAVEARGDFRVGRRLDVQMTMGNDAMDSRGYLFYRGLFLLKGRVSAKPDLMPGEIFDRFTNHAMATLVPLVRVRSTGGCHKSTIYYDPEAADAAVQLIAEVAAANLRTENELCTEVLDETVPQGHRAMPLVFDPAMWGGKG